MQTGSETIIHRSGNKMHSDHRLDDKNTHTRSDQDYVLYFTLCFSYLGAISWLALSPVWCTVKQGPAQREYNYTASLLPLTKAYILDR